MLFHAFEVATDGAYEMGVNVNENTLTAQLQSLTQTLATFGEEIETIAIGTIEATTVEDALNKIRAGNWQYSQKV